MKTPMQEMIEYFEIFQGADKSNQSMPLGIAISIAKSLLEKEKDAMCQFAFDYNDEYVNNGAVPPIQEYYEEYHNITLEQVLQTFNTKEK